MDRAMTGLPESHSFIEENAAKLTALTQRLHEQQDEAAYDDPVSPTTSFSARGWWWGYSPRCSHNSDRYSLPRTVEHRPRPLYTELFASEIVV